MKIEDHNGPSRAAYFDDTAPLKKCSKAPQIPVTRIRRGCAPIWWAAMLLHLLAPMAVAGLLWRGEQVEEGRGTILADRDAEWLRIFDPANGADYLRSRILQNLKVASPYVAVTLLDSEVQVIPVSTPWAVRCNDIAGISIAFSPNVADTSGGLIMQLSEARPNKEQCLDIALSVAQLLDAILAER